MRDWINIIEGSHTPLEDDPNDAEHWAALNKTGFFGSQGAGCIPMCKKTGRIMLVLRSSEVEQPRTWGNLGGAHKSDERPVDAARRELHEETGFAGNAQMIPLLVFQSGSFRYCNFLALVEEEFVPDLGWEATEARWLTLGDFPSPLHFGVEAVLNDSASAKALQHYASLSGNVMEAAVTDKIVKVDAPNRVWHGTNIERLCDILISNSLKCSKSNRDRGPTGISLTTDPMVARRFNAKDGKNALHIGAMLELDGEALRTAGYTFVKYNGAYAKKEAEVRIVAPAIPVASFVKSIELQFYRPSLMPGIYRYDNSENRKGDPLREKNLDSIIAEMRRIGSSSTPVGWRAPVDEKYLMRADILEHFRSIIKIS